MLAILTAFGALKDKGVALTSNISSFRGRRGAGSPHSAKNYQSNKDLLAADVWIICDGPVHQSGRKQVVFGARGDTNVDVTVYAAKRPLHSGHYGNWSPNPANMLAHLLASMKDDDGRVTIADWYADVGPCSEAERRAIADAPQYDEELKKQLDSSNRGGAEPARVDSTSPHEHQRVCERATSGHSLVNVIPTTATAVLDLRLVNGNDHQRQTQRLIEHFGNRVIT